MSDPVYLVITIDVEEEGLFSGRYLRTPSGVTNVAELRRLEFIPREFGFPLTLLVTYPVARDLAAQEVLSAWQREHGAEIGVHLHPWNTPPFKDFPQPEPIPTSRLPLTCWRPNWGPWWLVWARRFRRPPDPSAWAASIGPPVSWNFCPASA